MHHLRKIGRITLQVVLLILIWQLGNWLSSHLHLPIPGNVVGLLVLLLLLELKVVRLRWVESGGSWLVADMLLFFIPTTVGIIQYRSLILLQGWRILLAIALSTVVVMAATGGLADLLARRRAEGRVPE
ncbi:MAG: CidA/LrgA family protein [Mycobacterium leprae]